MLDCKELVTHVYKKYDSTTRQNILVSEIIKNASWFRTQQSSINNTTVEAKDIIKVRISLESIENIPEINKGDIMIRGKADIDNLSYGQIREEYPDSFTVGTVTYNLNSLPYSRHIRCEGN